MQSAKYSEHDLRYRNVSITLYALQLVQAYVHIY